MTNEAIYTVRVGSGHQCFLCFPEDGHCDLTTARLTAEAWRAAGYRGVRIINGITGQTER